MEKKTGTRTGRKSKSNPADRKYSFRLNAEENTKFEQLLAESGARDLTLFIKKSIFSGQIKVVKIDKATMDYYIKLTEFHRQFQAEKKTGTRTGRKSKSNPADRKYSFRLNAEENTKFEQLLAESGARDLTLFIKKSIFSGQIKVVKIDKATMDYYIKLTEFHRQFQAVGNNYNQVVRTLKNNFGEKRAMALLYRLEKLSIELMLVCKKVMVLTQEYERKWLQK